MANDRAAALPNIAYVPIRDAPQARWALVWRSASETDLLRSFVKVSEQLRARAP
jgi:hypothetical protein